MTHIYTIVVILSVIGLLILNTEIQTALLPQAFLDELFKPEAHYFTQVVSISILTIIELFIFGLLAIIYSGIYDFINN